MLKTSCLCWLKLYWLIFSLLVSFSLQCFDLGCFRWRWYFCHTGKQFFSFNFEKWFIHAVIGLLVVAELIT